MKCLETPFSLKDTLLKHYRKKHFSPKDTKMLKQAEMLKTSRLMNAKTIINAQNKLISISETEQDVA